MYPENTESEHLSRVVTATLKGFEMTTERFDFLKKQMFDMLDIIEAQGKRISVLSERVNLLEEK